MVRWSNWIKHDGSKKCPVSGGDIVVVDGCGVIEHGEAGQILWEFVDQYCVEVKSERETVVMYGCLVDLSGAWGFDGSELFEQPNTHIITFETEDGEPVLDSIKMEQL